MKTFKKHFVRTKLLPILAAFLFLFSATLAPYSANAISQDQKKLYSKNILYYDLACGGKPSSEASPATPQTGTGTVLFVGDSIGVGMRDSGELRKKILDKGFSDVVIDAAGSRSMKSPGASSTIGLQAIDARINERKPDTVVVELGTNSSGPASSFKNDMEDSIRRIKDINESANIYWVKVFSNVSHKSEYNDVMGEVAASKKINLVDMGSLNLPLPDGLHPGPDGYKTAASYLADEIVKPIKKDAIVPDGSGLDCACPDPSGSTLEGENNAIKAYNFFIGKDLSPAQASGIVGNMMRESGSDGYHLKPTIIGYNQCDPDCFGIVQWNTGRVANMRIWAESQNKNPNELETQLGYVWHELNKYPEFGLRELKEISGDDEDAIRKASRTFDEMFEISVQTADDDNARDNNAVRFYKEFVQGQGQPAASESSDDRSGSCGSSSAVTDAKLKETVKVDTKGKFIAMPSKYGCGGTSHRIDSRIAASVAYLITKYDMCITAGLEDGHNSHGAGLAIDVIPKNGNSKDAWKNSTEAASRAIGWYGDGADDPKGSKRSCANYGPGDYGTCMHQVLPDIFPKWMRWMGYNGAYCHGDPWHYYGCSAHLHLGWASPNGGDAVSPTEISEPIPSVYTFPAPVPDDLKGLVD